MAGLHVLSFRVGSGNVISAMDGVDDLTGKKAITDAVDA
jgi:hypothetical protein